MASFLAALDRLRITHEEEVSLLGAENARLRAFLQDALPVPTERTSLASSPEDLLSRKSSLASSSEGPPAKKAVSTTGVAVEVLEAPSNQQEQSREPRHSLRSQHEVLAADEPSVEQASVVLQRALTLSLSTPDERASSISGVVEPWVLLDIWNNEKTRMSIKKTRAGKTTLDWSDEQDEVAESQYMERPRSCISWFIAYPGSPRRLVWEIVGLLLILFDITMIPLDVFGLEGEALRIMSWVTRLFWTTDMVASLFVGYTKMGVTIMEPKLIAINYFRTWFFVDVIIVVPDWVMLALESGSDNEGMGDVRQTLRVLRVVRMLRLMRLLKLRRILTEIEDRINSEHTSIIIDLVKLLACLMSLNHLLACGWYFVGDSSGDAGGGRTWLVRLQLYGESVPYRYASCLHWSLTQFTPASVGIEPQNLTERTYAICVLIFAMVFFSSFVSSITSSMTHLRMLSEDKSKQMWLLRRFLRERTVSHRLTTRILRYLEFACEQQRHHVQESKVTIVALLSDQLRDELKCAITLPDLQCHILFRQIGKHSNITMNRIACSALGRKSLARGDSLFSFGDKASHMYFISSGQVRYTQPGGMRKMLTRGISLCEPVLWTSWAHLGEITAVIESDHLALDPIGFGKAVQVNPGVWQMAAKYGEAFVSCLNEVNIASLSDVATDMMPEKRLHQTMFMPITSIDSDAKLELEAETRK